MTVATSDSMPDLSWLADSPIFIDSQQINAFYDAVVGPAFRTVEVQISAGRTGQLEKSAGVRLGAAFAAAPAVASAVAPATASTMMIDRRE